MELINTLIIVYVIPVFLSGIMMLCEMYKYIKEEITWIKRNYSNKTNKEIYNELKNKIKIKITNDNEDPFIGVLSIFMPIVNILLFIILFINCIIGLFEKLHIWDYIKNKIVKYYLKIIDFLLKKQLNLKGEKND